MSGLDVSAPPVPRSEEVLTPEALDFVADLDARFHERRDELLAARRERRAEIARTGTLDFLPGTAGVRAGDWTVAPVPADLTDRRVEITGPTDPKMAINALNSGARVWLADLEDANTPHWRNVVGGQLTLRDAVRGRLAFTSPEGKHYAVADPGDTPVVLPRPRGWHFDEAHLTRDAGPDFTLPDRNAVTMAAPMMKAYSDLLVRTCHRRGAFAIGGMAAFIPSRRDPEVNERAFAKVREDKTREARAGFDGSWVAHPDLVPLCAEVFDAVLAGRDNQLDVTRDDVSVTAADLLAVDRTP